MTPTGLRILILVAVPAMLVALYMLLAGSDATMPALEADGSLRLTVPDRPGTGQVPMLEVPAGRLLALVIDGPAAGEVHVHGYDLVAPLAAGGSATIRFPADSPGIFPVEFHGADGREFRIAVLWVRGE